MVVIIAGADGVGKTTLIENMKKVWPRYTYIKESYPGSSTSVRISRMQDIKKHAHSSDMVIYDRATLLDDTIYEPIMNERESVYKNEALWKEVCTVLNDCCIIYLKCTKTLLLQRINERGDDYIHSAQLGAICARYEETLNALQRERVVDKPVLNQHTIDVTHMSEQQVCDIVCHTIGNYTIATEYAETTKALKVAHIVPLSLLEMTSKHQYHMCLAHLVKESEEYASFYRRMSDEGKYVLMDNGAAENAQLTLEELIECYKKVNPTEIVLPDTLCNGDETILKTKNALKRLTRKCKGEGLNYKFMAVPQGRTLEEWLNCARVLLECEQITSLGISKFLTIETKDPTIRYRAVEALNALCKAMDRHVEIHLLGCDSGPVEVARIREVFSNVRGCDTALSFIYAKAGIEITSTTTRPKEEILFLTDVLDEKRVELACNAFDELAGVKDNYVDSTWR